MDAVFDMLEFSCLPGEERLEYLSRIIELSADEIRAILELDAQNGDLGMEPSDSPEDLMNLHHVYEFYIFLNYLLHCAEFKTELFKEFWEKEKSDLYEHCFVKPPWYDLGAKEYLKSEKLKGLSNALNWIIQY